MRKAAKAAQGAGVPHIVYVRLDSSRQWYEVAYQPKLPGGRLDSYVGDGGPVGLDVEVTGPWAIAAPWLLAISRAILFLRESGINWETTEGRPSDAILLLCDVPEGTHDLLCREGVAWPDETLSSIAAWCYPAEVQRIRSSGLTRQWMSQRAPSVLARMEKWNGEGWGEGGAVPRQGAGSPARRKRREPHPAAHPARIGRVARWPPAPQGVRGQVVMVLSLWLRWGS